MNNKQKYIVSLGILLMQIILYMIIFYRYQVIPFDRISHIICLIILFLNCILILKSYERVKLSKKELIFIVLINMIISFFIGGKTLFLTNNILSFPMKSIILYILVNIFIAPFIYNGIYLIDNISFREVESLEKRRKNSWKFALKIFLIFTLIWVIAGIGYYPGNVTSDTVSQIAQALGKYPIDNAHPALCTIIIRWLFYIWKNPFIIFLADVLFMSSVLAYIYKYLYERNINRKVLYISAFFFALLCNNLSLMIMVWKDIPFTIVMLLLTFETYKLSKYKDDYFSIKNIIIISFTIALTYFFRHNGVIPALFTILYLILLFLKSKCKKRIAGTILLTIFLIWFIKGPLYSIYKVDSSNIMSSGTASFAAKGLGAVVHYEGEMTKEDSKEIAKLAKLEDLKEYYDPYSIDEYSFKGIGWDDGIQKLGVSKIYRLYIQNIFKNPRIIIRDRLDSCNLLWSYPTPPDGFNYKYDVGIAFPSYVKELAGIKPNEGILYIPKENIISYSIRGYRAVINKVIILDILFWRPAFILSVLLLLIFRILTKQKRKLPMTFPTLTSILFWIVFMSHQSYRYLWFILVNTFFIFLFLQLEKEEKLKKRF